MILFANNATTQVAGSITATSTQIAVSAGGGAMFPAPGPGDYFVATLYKGDASGLNEIVHVTNRVGDTMDIERAQEGTQGMAWNPGDTFSALLTAGCLAEFEQIGGNIPPSSLIYVGQDTGGANTIVVPTLIPTPTALVQGMTFDIQIATDNTGASSATMNGFPTYPVTRIDGSPLGGGDLQGGVGMKMWFDGTRYVTPLRAAGGATIGDTPPPNAASGDLWFNSAVGQLYVRYDDGTSAQWIIAVNAGGGKGAPPQTTFYVAPNGNDANDGLTPTTAFQTGQGAINAIKDRYISEDMIKLQFADGVYPNGMLFDGSYIASWLVSGNTVDPSRCLIDARALPNATRGTCLSVREDEVMIEGLMFRSYQNNISANPGGLLTVRGDCVFTTPVGQGVPISSVNGGMMRVWGNNTYIGDQTCGGLIAAGHDSMVLLGAADQVIVIPVSFAFQGVCDFTVGTIVSNTNSIVTCPSTYVTWQNGGVVTGPRFAVGSAGGIAYTLSETFIPGSLPGTKNAATYGWYT